VGEKNSFGIERFEDHSDDEDHSNYAKASSMTE